MTTVTKLERIQETRGGTPLDLIAIRRHRHGAEWVAYYSTESGSLYVATSEDPEPQRYALDGKAYPLAYISAEYGLSEGTIVADEVDRIARRAEERRAERIADAAAEVESRVAMIREADEEGDLPVDPRRAEGEVGAIKRNAQRWVEWHLATLWEDYRESGMAAAEAADAVIDSVRSRLIREAQHAPRSSDWLALPRWAAHVEALGTAAESGSYEMRLSASLHYLIRAAR